MGTTVNIVCYRNKKLSNGESPLMVRICKDRKTKYKSLGISVNPVLWDFDKNKPKSNCSNLRNIITAQLPCICRIDIHYRIAIFKQNFRRQI